MVGDKKFFGFTLIELLIIVAIVGILTVMALFAAKLQIAKARDGRRKADLAKIQKALEDYMNDENCYPDNLDCGVSFEPYLSTIPCDPINNAYYNYFYSYNGEETCKSWYKIYAKLENTKDPIIEKVGCAAGCGPSANYNYWVASPNMNKVERTAGEFWWPEIVGVTPTVPPAATLSPTPTTILTPTSTVTASPIPTPPPGTTLTPTALPTPTSPPQGDYYGCFSGVCTPLSGPVCSPNYIFSGECSGEECCFYQCSNPENECK